MICTNPYLSNVHDNYVHDKNTGYFWTRTFSNDPNFRRGYHVLDDDFQRTNETGNAIINTSRYGSDENTQESTRNATKIWSTSFTGSQTIQTTAVTY